MSQKCGLSRPHGLLATLLLLGCGASERPEASVLLDAPNERSEASVLHAPNERSEASVLHAPNERLEARAPGSTACPRFPEGTGAWTCTGPMWVEISEDHRGADCKTAKGVASTQTQAKFNAIADCRAQVFGSDCRPGSVVLRGLHCEQRRDL